MEDGGTVYDSWGFLLVLIVVVEKVGGYHSVVRSVWGVIVK